MNKNYQIEFLIHGIFPTDESNLVNEQITILSTEATSGNSVIRIDIKSDSEENAIEKSLIELDKILDLYSLFTILNFEILNERLPLKISQITEPTFEREISVENDTLKINFDIDVFTRHLPDCWEIISNSENKYIKKAINFLKRARSSTLEENQIINCFIAIETLFSYNEGTELGFRISNRMAILLANSNSERTRIRLDMKKLYKLRSSIVHGGNEFHKGSRGSLFLYVRESIFRFLSLSQIYNNHEAILEEIDNAMIDNDNLIGLRRDSSKMFDPVEAASTSEKPKIEGPKNGSYKINYS